MGLVLANDLPVLDGSRICIPRTGAWHADLIVDKPDALEGAVRLSIGDGTLVMTGTADRGGAFVDTARVRVVGGAGGLATVAEQKHYTDTSLRLVLGDLLDTAGETLSATADSGVLGRSVEHWTTLALPVGRVIARLMSSVAPDAAWRVLADGSIWVGVESWADSGLAETDYEIVHQADEQDFARLGIEVPRLQPGTTLAGRRVSYVEYQIGPGVRMEVWFGDGEHDRFKAAISGAVKGAVPDLEYRVWYEATIDHQSGNTVDVAPDLDELVPTMGSVPLAFGIPGVTAEGASGGKVLVGWEGGDPSKPRAFAFDPATSVTKLVIAAMSLFLGAEVGAQPTYKGTAHQTLMTALLGAFATYLPIIQPIADPSGTATTTMLTALTTFLSAQASTLTTKAKVF